MTVGLDLYWLPLGAGGRLVRLNGRIYEAVLACRQRRRRLRLYHAALIARLPEGWTTVEMGPVWDRTLGREAHGAVVVGPVGAQALGRWRWFRYELRCWPGGVIPDLAWAVASPLRLTSDEPTVRAALAAVATVPALTWGRDEGGFGEMWNSNSAIAWILARAGLDPVAVAPPPGGRAPGFRAGIVAAQRATGRERTKS